MFDVRCSMFDVRCSMFDVRCSRHTADGCIMASSTGMAVHITTKERVGLGVEHNWCALVPDLVVGRVYQVPGGNVPLYDVREGLFVALVSVNVKCHGESRSEASFEEQRRACGRVTPRTPTRTCVFRHDAALTPSGLNISCRTISSCSTSSQQRHGMQLQHDIPAAFK
jgi:hypothetical protein